MKTQNRRARRSISLGGTDATCAVDRAAAAGDGRTTRVRHTVRGTPARRRNLTLLIYAQYYMSF